jgi:hypothetical protein
VVRREKRERGKGECLRGFYTSPHGFSFIQFIRSTCSLIMELLYCELRIVPRKRSISAAVRALSGKGREEKPKHLSASD